MASYGEAIEEYAKFVLCGLKASPLLCC